MIPCENYKSSPAHRPSKNAEGNAKNSVSDITVISSLFSGEGLTCLHWENSGPASQHNGELYQGSPIHCHPGQCTYWNRGRRNWTWRHMKWTNYASSRYVKI